MKGFTWLLSVFIVSVVSAADLVKNSDFTARSANNPHQAEAWQTPPEGAGWSVTDEDGHSGKDALRYQSSREQTVLPVTQEVVCRPNTEYVLSAWMKSDGALRPVVRVVAPGLGDAQVVRVASDGARAWTRFAARFNSGKAERLLVQVHPSDEAVKGKPIPPGRVDVDDVQIIPAVEVPSDQEVVGGLQRRPPGENVALGRPYSLSPRPNYGYCTDPEDMKQITDGQYTVGYFWTQRSTVGWTHARPIIITLDLGQPYPIRGVSFNTAAGVAQVTWPTSIEILVSDDGKTFYSVGELISLSAPNGLPPAEGYRVHRYWTDQLKTHGRFVTFLIGTSGPYTFVDEIEVYKGEADWLQVPHPGAPIADVQAHFRATAIRFGVERRLRADIASIREAAAKANLNAEAQARIAAELDAAQREMLNLPKSYPADFRAVLPLNALHERIFRAQAMLWRALGLAPLTVWSANRWDPMSPTDTPPLKSEPQIAIAMMQNEYRSGAFNISNAGEAAANLRVSIAHLPGGENPQCVTVHEVAWTDTAAGIPVAAALPQARREGADYLITVPAGMTRQVWLTFNSANVPPGDHRGEIRLSSDTTTLTVPISLRVYALRFPAQPSLGLGGCDYTDAERMYDITPQNRDLVIAHLREHFVDSPWATAAVLPPGEYDAQGHMTREPDTARFDQWIQRWPGARRYFVFAAVGKSFAGTPIGEPLFNTKVRAWITFWAQHAKDQGIEPHQIHLLLVDEPSRPEQDEIILAWAKAIRAANTGVRIWEDPCHADPSKANQEMLAACDVLCPNRPMFLKADDAFRAFYARQPSLGRELAFYSCSGPAHLLDPYAYHRLQAWTAWQYGAKSCLFWAFGDAGGGSSWNEYAAQRTGYVPFFLDATTVTAGKHMEAVREGVEDYEYFVMLRDKVEQAQRAGLMSDALERAKKLLAEGAVRVCSARGANDLNWSDPKDRTIADKVRVEILEALAALEAG